MKLNKKYFVWITSLLCLFIILSGKVSPLQSQEYFPRGVFGLDNPNNFNENDDEMQLIYGTYVNYLFGVVNDEASVMIFCRDTTEGDIKMNLERDPTGYQYHVHIIRATASAAIKQVLPLATIPFSTMQLASIVSITAIRTSRRITCLTTIPTAFFAHKPAIPIFAIMRLAIMVPAELPV